VPKSNSDWPLIFASSATAIQIEVGQHTIVVGLYSVLGRNFIGDFLVLQLR
jgi:hypothetical protein